MDTAAPDEIPTFADLTPEEREEVAACLRDVATAVATSPMQLGAMFIRDFRELERRIPHLAKTPLRDGMAARPWVS